MSLTISCDLFAQRGNPWISERDRMTMPMMPPSKAHRRRLQRAHEGFVDALPAASPETAAVRLARHQLNVKAQLRALLA